MDITGLRRSAVAAALLVALAGCGGDDEAVIGQSGGEEVGEVVLTSDDSTDTVQALCVSDIPADLTACPGAPANLGQVELDQTLKATLVVPLEVATGGYRLRLDGEPLPRLEGILEDRNQVLLIPPEAFTGDDETVLTVEALRSREHPRAVWQFLLDEPDEQSG